MPVSFRPKLSAIKYMTGWKVPSNRSFHTGLFLKSILMRRSGIIIDIIAKANMNLTASTTGTSALDIGVLPSRSVLAVSKALVEKRKLNPNIKLPVNAAAIPLCIFVMGISFLNALIYRDIPVMELFSYMLFCVGLNIPLFECVVNKILAR